MGTSEMAAGWAETSGVAMAKVKSPGAVTGCPAQLLLKVMSP